MQKKPIYPCIRLWLNTKPSCSIRRPGTKLKLKTSRLDTKLRLHNSHKPSSTDGFKKPIRTQSLIEKSGLKPGGQPGHKGHFKSHANKPDEIILHQSKVCSACKKPLRRSVVVKKRPGSSGTLRTGNFIMSPTKP